jgi:hypothetical protein
MGKGGGGLGGIVKTQTQGLGLGGSGGGAGDLFGSLARTRNDVFGISDQAKYAQQAAMAEQAQRQAVTAEARAARERMNLAAQSPQQLAALERGLSAAQTQVDADLRQLAAIDPAIMEASKQVLTLLQGGKAAVNDPAMQQRQAQRQQLVDSLKAQYGPGAESTSVGQRALRQFDMESATMFQQNQQNTLGNLFGMATHRVQGAGFGQLMTAAGGFGDYQNRILGAEQAGSQGILQGMTGEVQGAGAQFTADLLKAGGRRQWFSMMEDDGRQIGRTWATMGAGGKGGQKPTSGGGVNSGRTGGYGLSAADTTDDNFWSKNPYE